MALSVHIKKKLKDFELAVDFDMDEGIVGFLGSSGCGKSMTLNVSRELRHPMKEESSLMMKSFSIKSQELIFRHRSVR